ncbi:hypothetical protein AB1Y20_000411 [Prymnesium parvum]|uniref:Protein-tyrosine-phosphatase n=1 Tax=Prymnesium parvum TaxID=97485 RepID=A0AB34KAD0_PRYPA
MDPDDSTPVDSAAGGVQTLLLMAVAVYLGLYILYYKKLLPKACWLPLSKFYFYPMLIPSYIWRLLVVRGTYFSDVDDKVLLGAVPLVFAGHVQELHKRGVRATINMMAEYEGPLKAYAAMNPPITQLHLPVTDHIEPTAEQLQEAVNFIAERTKLGQKVLIHCKGGHGRAAAVAFAYLMSPTGGSKNPDQAQAHLNAIRKVRAKLYLQDNLTKFYHNMKKRRGTREMM